jgi:tetratricopeptide (TPR) repeat protein
MQGDWQKANAHYSRAQHLDPAWNSSTFSGGNDEAAEGQLRSLVEKNPKDLKSRYLLARTYANLSFAALNRLLAQDPNSFRAHQLQAQSYAYREENDKALAEYRIVEQDRPELPGLHFEIGQLLWKKRENTQALAALKQELRLNPGHAEANADIGAILVAEHQPDQAIPYLKTALRLKPDLTMVHEQLGRAYYQRKEFGKAAEELRQGLAADDEGNLHYELGMADKQLGHVAEAEAAFEESRKIKAERLAKAEITNEPQAAEQQYQLAVSLSQQGKYAEALTWFERLAQANPQSAANQFNLALAYLNAKRPNDSIRVLQGLTASNSTNPNALGLLGRAYEAEGKLGDALSAYLLALNADPKNPDRYLDYTQLLMDGNRFEEAARVTMNGFNVVADPYPLYVRLGSVRLIEGKAADARQAFQEAIQLHSEIALGYVALAKSYLKEGAGAEAAKILSDARKKLPPDFALDYFYGVALLRLQQNRESAGVLENAVHLGPAVPEAHYELGRAYFELGENDRARAEFERTIQLAPQDARAHYQLSRVYEKLGDRAKAEQLAQATKRLKQTKLEEALEIQKRRLESFERE